MGSPGDAFWQLQLALRKNSMLLPGLLLLMSAILVVYEHMTSDRRDYRTFLMLVLATMVPLAYIDTKISSRADPIGLLCSFGGRVLLMHCCFLVMRFRLMWYPNVFYLNLINVVGFVASSLAVVVGFVLHSLLGASAVRDVACTVLLVIVVAAATEITTWGLHLAKSLPQSLLLEISGTASEYGEILSFVPAVWIVFRADKKDSSPVQVTPIRAKFAATAFSSFLVGFYFFEDIVAAAMTFREERKAAIAHVLHFLLLSDLATFLLISAWNPHKANKTVLQSFSDAWQASESFV
mmetsp:Transcript_62088/g.139891  ORF Transcript_62088/g.139891 Transcript_62088/m.139891 type:complete len:294 (-) Transcript_62088:116-997(-)|eukprot:CAMPEP_0197937574 /NCGR_PEP_ID=MMETSP1439-20131203/116708_1 /TAXON_ID=66791 /ORGANISM="Gonyaulax spinifera, Strain CCMP409" /LENGTH=293 /DNA_ID=CAMNT_0043560605 /DNA_START=69 /DNA_END=950 /DNA_ORIENTATION=+